MAKLQIFNGEVRKVLDFLTVYRLFIKMRMRNDSVEEQIQWMLLYVQKRSADISKENILKNLEIGTLEYGTIGKFLTD